MQYANCSPTSPENKSSSRVVAETDIVTLSIVPGVASAAFPPKKKASLRQNIHPLLEAKRIMGVWAREREETAICHPLPCSLLIQQLGERVTPDPL